MEPGANPPDDPELVLRCVAWLLNPAAEILVSHCENDTPSRKPTRVVAEALSSAQREMLLDLAFWEEGLEKYATAMHLMVALVDEQGGLLGRCLNVQPTWSLFARQGAVDPHKCPFHLNEELNCDCVAEALNGDTIIRRRNSIGLVHFAVPLSLAGQPLGALLAGQVFDHFPEQLQLDQAAKRYGMSPERVGQVARREHPVSRATLGVYVELLEILGRSILQTRYDAIKEADRLKELTRLQEELRQAQKMETLGRLAGGIAHDFNNLMTPILGYCHLLLTDLAPEHPVSSSLRVIERCAERAAGVTGQLLAFSQKQILVPKVLDLNMVVEMERTFAQLLGEDIEWIFDLDPNLGRVKVDPGQVWQVLLNLAINARDAMPTGGRLTIATRNVDWNETLARNHPASPPGPYVRLSVSDTGLGMDEQLQSHLFEPFFTTKEQGKGTGLGLASTHGIIVQSGGHIEVRSAPGQGSVFSIFLPRVSEAPAPNDEISLPVDSRPATATILLVEDEESIRRLASLVLLREGYTVLEAAHGGEAAQLGDSHHGSIDLLLTDVVMPQMGGKDLAEYLRRNRPNLKVVYMSGHSEVTILDQEKLGNGIAFLRKPFTPDTLCREIRATLTAEAHGADGAAESSEP